MAAWLHQIPPYKDILCSEATLTTTVTAPSKERLWGRMSAISQRSHTTLLLCPFPFQQNTPAASNMQVKKLLPQQKWVSQDHVSRMSHQDSHRHAAPPVIPAVLSGQCCSAPPTVPSASSPGDPGAFAACAGPPDAAFPVTRIDNLYTSFKESLINLSWIYKKKNLRPEDLKKNVYFKNLPFLCPSTTLTLHIKITERITNEAANCN